MKKILMLTAVIFAGSALLLPAQTNKSESAGHTSLTKAQKALANLELEWAGAVKQRDVEKIDQLQAEEYTFTDPAGKTWAKARALASIKAGDLEIDSFELSDVQVKIYGKTAVVTFAITWNGNFRGNDISGPQRMTDVFVKRAGHWQCVASQATRIRSP